MNVNCSLRCLPFLVLALLATAVSPKPSRHKIRFTFSYDFGITPPCSSTVKERCVQQFNFYEISPGISKSFLFTSGRHMVAVSAQMPDGSESDLSQCTKTIKIH